MNTTRFDEAISRFDAENSRDPHRDSDGARTVPRELLYAERLTEWVQKLAPEASEALRLAARCQHLCRWEIPRSSYAMTRAGYLRWRADLKEFHARRSGEILREVGYPDAMVLRVQDLNRKKNPATDPECQTLEDALCLVTLQYQLDDLIARTAPDTMVSILRKTWKKMSPAGRAAAQGLDLSPAARQVLGLALDGGESHV